MCCGCYDGPRSRITLYFSGKNNRRLTPQDIRENDNRMADMCHEAVHALFKHDNTEKEISYSTGTLEIYTNDCEIGRGINEGLTNWVVQKIGLHPSSYGNLTCLINELELAIGPKRVMNLCKGDLRRNVPRQLDMSSLECKRFLAKADEVYSSERKIGTLNRYIYNIQNNKNIDNMPEFVDAIKRRDFLERQIDRDLLDLENTIINKYCIEECYELLEDRNIDLERANRFFKLSRLFLMQDNPNLAIFDKLMDKYCKAIPDKRIRNGIKNGTLSRQDIMDYKNRGGSVNNRSNESITNAFQRELNRDRKNFEYRSSQEERELLRRIRSNSYSQNFDQFSANERNKRERDDGEER